MGSLLQSYGQSLIGLSGQLEEYVFDLEEYCLDVRTYNLLCAADDRTKKFGSNRRQHYRCARTHSTAEWQAGVYIL